MHAKTSKNSDQRSVNVHSARCYRFCYISPILIIIIDVARGVLFYLSFFHSFVRSFVCTFLPFVGAISVTD